MAYDGKVMREALQRFEEDKQRRASQAAARRQRIYREVPRLEEIEQQLRGTMGRIMAQALRRGEDPVPAIQRLRAENLSLQQERAQLLTAHGYPADALVDKPRCVLCGDTGYCGGRICACLQKYYAQEQIRSLSSLLDVGSQSFDTFGLEWYDTQPGESGRSPRQLMERNLATCQRYAAEFGKKPANLLLDGAPGLGKTFLSACIARTVADGGHSVVYESAPHLFAKWERAKFGGDEDARREVEKYTACDLLIVDDLGTEMPGQFTTATLYLLINDRLLEGKPTIISTNLNSEDLARRYSPQIAFRLRGSYTRVAFLGDDIRVLKSRGL